MTDHPAANIPLVYGKLAPAFELESITGETLTRNQFRNRNALLILFCQDTSETQNLFELINRDSNEYAELNVRVLAIVRTPVKDLAALSNSFMPTITYLADPHGKAWQAYTQQQEATTGCAAFMLDLYGGVDAQIVTNSAADLPDATTLLEWARAAQYKCNI